MDKIYLTLLEGGQIKILCKCENVDRFDKLLNYISTNIPIVKYIMKGGDYHISNIYQMKYIKKVAFEKRCKLLISKKLENYLRIKRLRFKKIKEARKNKIFTSKFWTDDKELKTYDYQAQAINVCYAAKRFLIGDDMGLGKTLVGIGLICKLYEDGGETVLVVCNNRLKYQWKGEILRFSKLNENDVYVIDFTAKFKCRKDVNIQPNFNKIVCNGCNLLAECKKLKAQPNLKRIAVELLDKKILICSYDNLDRLKDSLIKKKFDLIVADEFSRCKNYSSKMTKALMNISNNCPYGTMKFPMSGTFIENRLDELYPALAFIDKNLVGNYTDFKNNYLIFDFWGNCIGNKNEKRLKNILDKNIIRRTIDQVWKDRPTLIENYKECEMTEKQRDFYEKAKEGILKELNDKALEQKINYANIAPLLMYLIQICDTCESIDPNVQESGKIETLKEMLEYDINKKHKVLIFSFFANKVIPILERELKKFGKVCSITGNTKPEEGERIKNRFMRVEDLRFMVCSDSMSYGANLQCARYVINFDLPWNPAKIDQRIRRVYRIGQKFPVEVINMITPNSVEDRIMEKLSYKRKLFDMFLGNKKAQQSKFGVDQILKILKD